MDLSQLAGNAPLKRQLELETARRGLSHAYILSGQRGSGRHTLARLLCAALVCTGAGERPCRNCTPCRKVQQGIHPDVRWVGDDGKDITVGQVRALRSDAYIRPNEAQRKVYVIENAQTMNASAQNAMLKLLEEGPAYAAFLLLTDNAAALLPTVRSRCEVLALSPVTQEQALSWLREAYPDRPAAQLQALAGRCEGLLGRAVAELEGVQAEDEAVTDTALASGFSPESIRFAPEFPTDAELAVPAADLVLDDGGLLLRLERERPLPARLGLRLRPEPDRSFHKAEATRFGMRTGELLDTAQELRLKGVREVGLSAMLGLGLRDPEAFSALARALFTCAAALHGSFGLQVSYCCLGGGLPVAHRRTERDADIAAVSRGVQAEFSRIMEPSGLGGVPVETGLGHWLTAHAGILLTTVTGVKRGAQDWLGVDVSRADLLRPELYGTYHHISVLGDDRVEGRRRYAVGDRIPEPREPFGQRLLPECRRGAHLVIHDVGAYGASMGYSYGLTPHCAEYLYQADGTLRCIRRAQREDELFSTLDENPDFTAPAETPSGQAESQRPSEG